MADTFAVSTPQPVQRQAGLAGSAPNIGSRGGGQTQGGAVNANAQSNPGESNLPEVLTNFFAPQLKQRQDALFVQGQLRAHTEGAMQEIEDSRPKWANTFGPSYYEEGAAFYTSQKAVADYYTNQASKMDDLVKMSPEEVQAQMGQDLQGMMTPNESANLMIKKGFLDNSAQFMSSYVSARRTYQQAEAQKAQYSNAITQGSLYSANERNITAAEGAGADTITPEREAGRLNFLASLEQAPGQTEKSYLDNLSAIGKGLMEGGNFAAYHAFKSTEGWSRLDPDKQNQLLALEDRYEDKANTDAAPQFRDRIVATDIKLEQYKTYLAMTPSDRAAELKKGYVVPSAAELMAERQAISDDISRLTGTKRPYFSEEQIRSLGTGLADAMGQAARSKIAEDRADARAAATAQHTEDVKKAEADLSASKLNAAFAVGTVNEGIQLGSFTKSQWDYTAVNAFRAGNYAPLIRNYLGKAPMDAVKNEIETTVQSGAGKGYTNSFNTMINAYRSISQVNLGAAMAMFGSTYDKMSRADSLVQSGMDPQSAYDRTFGIQSKDMQEFFPSLPNKKRDEIRANAEKALDRIGAGFIVRDTAKPLDALKFRVTPWIAGQVGARTGGREPTTKEVEATVSDMMVSGELSVYGAYTWHQDGKPVSLHKALGVDEKTLSHLLPRMINSAFGTEIAKRSPENSITDISQLNTPQGIVLHMFYTDPATGHIYPATLTQQDMDKFRHNSDLQRLYDNKDAKDMKDMSQQLIF